MNMTVQQYIKQGNNWIDLKGVPVREQDSENIVFIHNKFFEGKELEFQNKVISSFMEHCPDCDWNDRVYGGETPDADRVSWIYTQVAEIVRTVDAVRDYLENKGAATDNRYTKFIHGWHTSKALVEKTARIFSLNWTYEDGDGEFTLSGFDN